MKCLLLALGILLGLAGTASAEDVRFVVIHKAGMNWVPDLDFSEQPYIATNPDSTKSGETHIAFYKKLFSEGKMALGGPMLDSADPQTQLTKLGTQVGMMISAPGLALTKEDWEKIASDDPAVKAGVLSFEVREWFVAMKLAAPKPSPTN